MPIDLRSVVVIAVVVLACVWDLRTRRIPNALTYGAAAGALGFAVLDAGWPGVMSSAGGWITPVAIFFPFFALGGMGAGDVKLLGALGAWLGAPDALLLVLSSALAGGVVALAIAIAHGYLGTAFRNLQMLLAFWLREGIRPHPELALGAAPGPKLAYAIPIALGAVTTLWLRG